MSFQGDGEQHFTDCFCVSTASSSYIKCGWSIHYKYKRRRFHRNSKRAQFNANNWSLFTQKFQSRSLILAKTANTSRYCLPLRKLSQKSYRSDFHAAKTTETVRSNRKSNFHWA